MGGWMDGWEWWVDDEGLNGGSEVVVGGQGD